MRKILKFLSIVIISVVMLFAFIQPVSLAVSASEIIDSVEIGEGKDFDSEINNIDETITNWIWEISIIIAIISVIYIGMLL